MIISSPVVGVEEQVLGRLSERPVFAHERGHAAADGEVDSLNECGLYCGAEALVSEQLIEDLARSPEHTRDSEGEMVALFALGQLAVEEIIRDMPVVSSCLLRAKPGAEVRGDGVEVTAQSVVGEGGDAVIVQTQLEIMEEGTGVFLLARPGGTRQME